MIITGLVLLLIAAIISINYKNGRIRELERCCRELNDDIQELSTLTCTTTNQNTNLQEQIDFADARIEDLIEQNNDLEDENMLADRKIDALTKEDLETAKEKEDRVIRMEICSKGNRKLEPMTEFDKYYLNRAINSIYNEEGNK